VGHPRFDSILLSGELQEWYPAQRWMHQNQKIELRPGHPSKDHFLKGLYERRALQKLLADKTLNPSDRAIVNRLLTDLQSALSSATK
jgi:hypothetical protein